MSTKLLANYFYIVLAPSIQTNDENLDYYYDFTQSINEYTKVFKDLGLLWKWQPVTIKNYKQIIEELARPHNGLKPFVINLCDGDDVNDTPGENIIHELEKLHILYSGANAFFYNITTSKIPMKKAFDNAAIPTAKWKTIHQNEDNNIEGLSTPVIIKPAVSGGSMGISLKNVVHDTDALNKQIAVLQAGYRGWNLMIDGLFVEEFIIGQEFTTFIIGSYTDLANCIVYEPIQRVFHSSLSKEEQFLSFDRLWEIYEEEEAMPNNANFYDYHKVENKDLIMQLKQLTINAFAACKGIGYARLDFRLDEKTNKLICLEVNAQCGLSEDEDYTSIGAIIRASNSSFTSVIKNIITETIERAMPKPE